ncbi:MAG TPA: galactokinase [Mycobacteriales bacterium]|nr:galactokinase [Mycobacteriales bacterium]
MGQRDLPFPREEARLLSTASAFEAAFGGAPDGVWCAPGRVNLIGEHTDYNEGLVLPLAIDLECRVAARPRTDGVLRLVSAQLGDGGAVLLADRRADDLIGWARYVVGMAWALQDAGLAVGGADLLVDSDVPAGAGLSSSAALECSAGLALCHLVGLTPDPMVLAHAGQAAETRTVGAPVGVMDQVASSLGSAEGPVLLDCRSLTTRSVPLPLVENGLALVTVDTRVEHDHASSGYAARRRECEWAAAALGVASLRDATVDDLHRLDGVLLRRARHVVTEIARVVDAVEVLDEGRVDALGPLFAASHASLRDDFEVSCPELDLAVAAALAAGALVARMTGGGFGGSVVALVPHAAVQDVERSCRIAAHDAGAPEPDIRVVGTATGARRCG